MKTKNLTLKAVVLGVLASAVAHAEIPSEVIAPHLERWGDVCKRQAVTSQYTDGVVHVVSGVVCHNYYADIQLIEVEIENRNFDKEIYLVDRNQFGAQEKTVKFVRDARGLYQLEGGSAAYYIGKTEDGRDRFVVSVASYSRPVPPLPIDIYVKMNGAQYSTVQVRFDR